MAITTVNDKLAVMELGQVWEPGLPISPGALDQADLQQLLWGYPGVLWGEGVEPTIAVHPSANFTPIARTAFVPVGRTTFTPEHL